MQPIQAEASDGEFRLVLKSAGARYAFGAPIALVTELHYIGREPKLRLGGSGSGLVVVSMSQLGGPLEIAGGGSDDCVHYSVTPGAPMVQQYRKSGGYSDSDPNVNFYRAFYADPLLRLPRGAWRVFATAEFYIGDCPGPLHRLNATLDLVVE